MNFSAILWRFRHLHQYWKISFSDGWNVSDQQHLHAARLFARHGTSIKAVEQHLSSLLKSSSKTINITDFGAVSGTNPQSGSSSGVPREVELKRMISRTASSEKWGRLLLRIAQLKAGNFNLELGTNLGVGLRYLVTGSHFQHQWISIEGDPNTANLARAVFVDHPQVSILTGQFKEILPEVLEQDFKLNLVFVDGHHDGLATQEYADQIASKMNSEGWMVLDDIRWSPSMKQAWEDLKNRSWVDRWVDLGKMGILVVK